MTIDAQILAAITDLLGRRTLTQVEMAAWFGGAADGGPYADGLFPLSDSTGFTRMVPSPARIAEQLLAPTGVAMPSVPSPTILDHSRKLAGFAFDLPAISVGGRLVQPLAISFDLQVLAGLYLDTGEQFSPALAAIDAAIAELAARLSVVEARGQAHAGQLARFAFDVPPISFGNRPFAPTVLSADLQPLAGHFLDDGSFFTPRAAELEATVQDHARELGSFAFDLPPIVVGGRLLAPTALSFDLQPLAGYFLDDDSEYTPRSSALEALVLGHSQDLAGFVFDAGPILVDNRPLQPATLSFDLQVLESTWLDTGEPFSPLAPDTAPAVALADEFVIVEPLLVNGRRLQPTALSFDLQVLQGVWLDDGALFGGAGGGGGGAMRIKPAGANTAYLITPRPGGGGALAHRFSRNLGGAGAADTGAPYEPWRRTGTARIASLEDDPAPAFTGSPPVGMVAYNLETGLGAVDYAVSRNVGGGVVRFAGSYHGGEQLIWSVGPDFTVVARLDSFRMERLSRLTWSDGGTCDVLYSLEIDAGGVLHERLTLTSTGSAGSMMIGMEIGSVTPNTTSGYTQVTADGQAYTVDPMINADTALGAARDVTLRNPTNGLTIRSISSAPFAYLGGGATYIATQAGSRSKLYFSRGGGPIGRVQCERAIIFGQS